MGKLKPGGVALGLAGHVLIAVALFGLLQAGECGDRVQPPCPGEPVPAIAALAAGIVVCAAAILLGGGAVTFAGILLAAGLGSMGASAFGGNERTEAFGWLFGGVLTVFGFAPLLIAAALRDHGDREAATPSRTGATGGRGGGAIAGAQPAAAADLRPGPARVGRPGIAFNPPVPAATAPSPLCELARLNAQRMAGTLTDEEFAAAKDRLLARLGADP